MVKILLGERIGGEGRIKVGAVAVIFDGAREKVLLTRRNDNGQWCLPGGQMEPGETAAECCEREVLEETGLRVRVSKLIGVYSSPNRLYTYPDGNRWQIVAVCCEARVVGGELGLSEETTAFGYFSREEIKRLDLLEPHRERIADAFAGEAAAFLR